MLRRALVVALALVGPLLFLAPPAHAEKVGFVWHDVVTPCTGTTGYAVPNPLGRPVRVQSLRVMFGSYASPEATPEHAQVSIYTLAGQLMEVVAQDRYHRNTLRTYSTPWAVADSDGLGVYIYCQSPAGGPMLSIHATISVEGVSP